MGEQKGGIPFPFFGVFNQGSKQTQPKDGSQPKDGYNFSVQNFDQISRNNNNQNNSKQQFQFEFQFSSDGRVKQKIKSSRFLRFLHMHDLVGREIELIRGGLLAVISGVGMEFGRVKNGVQRLNFFDNARVGILRDAMLAFQPSVQTKYPNKRRCQKQLRQQQKLARAHFDEGVQHVKDLRLKRAIQEFEKAVELEPNNVEYLAYLSKQWTDYTYVPETPPDTIREYNKKAMELAEKCIELDPSHPLGYMAMCASQGRLALYSDNRTKAQLAKTAREMSDIAVQKGPDFDYCHLIQGTWNYEMAGLNVVVRTVIRLLFGTSLEPGSYQDALQCFKRAEELNPNRQLTQVQLGKVYRKLGMEEECVKCLERSFEMGYDDVNEHLELITATTILREMYPHKQFKEYYDLIPPHEQQ